MNNPVIENVVFWMAMPFLVILTPFFLILIISLIRDLPIRKQTKQNSWNNL